MPIIGGTIDNQQTQGGVLINQSGIDFDLEKEATRPANALEVDGYRERFIQGASQATRVFDVPWTTRNVFLQWALGYAKNDAGTLKRVKPAQHPEWTWLFAQECELIQGLGFWYDNPLVYARDQFGNIIQGPNGPIQIPMIGYFDSSPAQQSKTLADGRARYAVTYRALDYALYTDATIGDGSNELTELNRWVSRDTTYNVQALKIPSWILKFKDTNEAIPEGGFLVHKTQEVIYHWHDVPDPPEQSIGDCLGKINDEDFDKPKSFQGQYCNGTPPVGYPKGTLLMMTGPEKKRYRTAAGRVCWDIIYRFLYNKEGHNFFPDANGTFREVERNNGQPLYESANYNTLFTQPSTPFLWQGPGG